MRAQKRKRLAARKMADIARLANVSESTVSRALNDSPLVNRATKARIQKLAHRHSYTINTRARSLRLKQSRTVAVLIPLSAAAHEQISDLFFLDMLGSIADALTERGYDMLLSNAVSHQDWHADFLQTGRADGIIAVGQVLHHHSINALAARGTAIVVWGAQLPEQHYCSVGSDNAHGARQAVDHLLQLGRRRIAFLGDASLPEIADRFAGYQTALREAGVTLDPALQVPAAFTAEAACRALEERLITPGVAFDAIFAASDELAISTIGFLQGRSIRVPADVAIVGYDDIRLAEHVRPALTTVRQNIAAGGRLLTEKLLQMIGGEPVESTVLPSELVIRESCGGGRSIR